MSAFENEHRRTGAGFRVGRIVVTLTALAVAGCRGPDPVVERQDVTIGADGRCVVVATLRNRASGSGAVEVRARVRQPDGRVVGTGEEMVELDPGERAQIGLAIDLPADLASRPARTRLVADVQAVYPPG